MKTSSDYLTSGRSIPTWVTGLAFISANLGALELVGMAASGGQIRCRHRSFLLGRPIPAMVFLAVFMMPFYYGSKSAVGAGVSEDAVRRARPRAQFDLVRGHDRLCLGISMNALAKLLHQLLGWNYDLSLWICSGIVLLYVLKAG